LKDYVDTLITDALIITMDKSNRIFKDGTIAIKNGKIVDVGKSHKIKEKYRAEDIINGAHKLVLPGFINTHTHLFQVLLKGLGDDRSILDWLPVAVLPYAQNLDYDMIYYAALAGSIELIKSGVTTILDFQYANPFSNASNAVLDAWSKLGVRGILARGIMDADIFNVKYDKLLEPLNQIFSSIDILLKRYHNKNNGMLRIALAPNAPFSTSIEGLLKTREFANKFSLLITTHLHESKQEVNQWTKLFGKTPLQYFNEKAPEFLGSDVLGVHCVWMNDKDISIMKEKDIKVSHNTVSNMYLASGVAPIPKFLKNGITVSLGVDGAASNNNQDFLELIKMTALLHKVSSLNPQEITAIQVLKMATIDGARAVMLEKEVGSIEIGKKADLVIFDIDNVQMSPLHNPLSQVVYCSKSQNIDTVIVNGEVIMKNRKILNVDEKFVVQKVQELAKKLVG